MTYTQLPLFDGGNTAVSKTRTARSGSFVDNMSLPVHRWFRYSAGFSAQWVEEVVREWEIGAGGVILDPFCGSGTVLLAGDASGFAGIGVEAHPFVARICRAKLNWSASVKIFDELAKQVMRQAPRRREVHDQPPALLKQSIDDEFLAALEGYKFAWLSFHDSSPESELVWLAITSILRPCSRAGTAQWQYILPNKEKKKVVPPPVALRKQIEMMKADMQWFQSRRTASKARVIGGDARNFSTEVKEKVDAVITSPPYANNYDYADALRFEMTFWGEVDGWGDLHDKVRKHLMVSSSQHASKEKLSTEEILAHQELIPIEKELRPVVDELARVREQHGGKKNYHAMVAAYFRDIALVMRELRKVCRRGAKMSWVIGDSAPYGVYCPVDRWIGELALAEGFASWRFEKLRDRNIKWKNRKHRVPLKEGIIWIEG